MPEINFDKLCKEYLDSAYSDLTGFISYEAGEKEKHKEEKVFLTYGEIKYESIDLLLSKIEITPDDIFCDLGSGIGKVVAQVFMKTAVKEAFGVVANPLRSASARKIQAQIQKDFPVLFEHGRSIDFYESNFLDTDISRASMVYTCSTCFSDELLQDIANMVDANPNIRCIFSLKALPCKNFTLKEVIDVDCSWDKSRCHFYVKNI
ncbi:MAG: hypothetical protein ACKOAD_09120 [Gammaproteobacteria bacterium]